MIAAGLGCRRSCAADDIVAAVVAALARAGRGLHEVGALYAPAARSDTPGLRTAATRLGKPLEFVESEQLARHSADAITCSERVQASLGVPSAAETAALAGAARDGGSTRLLGPRSVAGGATCALAVAEGP